MLKWPNSDGDIQESKADLGGWVSEPISGWGGVSLAKVTRAARSPEESGLDKTLAELSSLSPKKLKDSGQYSLCTRALEKLSDNSCLGHDVNPLSPTAGLLPSAINCSTVSFGSGNCAEDL